MSTYANVVTVFLKQSLKSKNVRLFKWLDTKSSRKILFFLGLHLLFFPPSFRLAVPRNVTQWDKSNTDMVCHIGFLRNSLKELIPQGNSFPKLPSKVAYFKAQILFFSTANFECLSPSSIYSWSISHILEHKFFCLGRLDSSGSKEEKMELSFSEELGSR